MTSVHRAERRRLVPDWQAATIRMVQHRYTGDIGDFGKYALLKALAGNGLRLGINWFLNIEEEQNTDGRITDYSELRHCDPALFDALQDIVQSGARSVAEVERRTILPPRTMFFSSPAPVVNGYDYPGRRANWIADATNALADADIVFLDPDNGFCRVEERGTVGPKHVHPRELQGYLARGQSVVVYQHSQRVKLFEMIQRHLRAARIAGAPQGWALVFRRKSVRVFYVLPSPAHRRRLQERIEGFLQTPWGMEKHFELAISAESERMDRGVRLFQYLVERCNQGDATGISYSRFLAYLDGSTEFREMTGRKYLPSDSARALDDAMRITAASGGRKPVQRGMHIIRAGMDTFIWNQKRPFDRPSAAWESGRYQIPYSREEWLTLFPTQQRRLIAEQELDRLRGAERGDFRPERYAEGS